MKFRLTKNSQIEGAAEHAKKAAEEGRNIFSFVHSNPAVPGAGIHEWIEAIEEEGWRLEHMTTVRNEVALNSWDTLLVFRRAQNG